MINNELETLINEFIVDNELSESDKAILIKKAQELGFNMEEVEKALNERLNNALASNDSGFTQESNPSQSNTTTTEPTCQDETIDFNRSEEKESVMHRHVRSAMDWIRRHYVKLLIAFGLVIVVIIVARVVNKAQEKKQELRIAEENRQKEELKLNALDNIFYEELDKDLEEEDFSEAIRHLREYKGPFDNIRDKWIRTIKIMLNNNSNYEAKALLIGYPELKEGFSNIRYDYLYLLERFITVKDYLASTDMIYAFPADYEDIKNYYTETVTALLKNRETILKAEKLYLKWEKEPQLFYTSFLKSGEYDKAEKYYFVETERTDKNYYAFLTDCVTDLCEKGQYEDAYNFINDKTSCFKTIALSSEKLSKRGVTRKLNKIVKKSKKERKKQEKQKNKNK